jgi:hypothetical protein
MSRVALLVSLATAVLPGAERRAVFRDQRDG